MSSYYENLDPDNVQRKIEEDTQRIEETLVELFDWLDTKVSRGPVHQNIVLSILYGAPPDRAKIEPKGWTNDEINEAIDNIQSKLRATYTGMDRTFARLIAGHIFVAMPRKQRTFKVAVKGGRSRRIRRRGRKTRRH
jgi:hypothetical protein